MIQTCVLHRLSLPLKFPMRTAHGHIREKQAILVQLVDADGIEGWSECVALAQPTYTEECTDTAWVMLVHHLVPRFARWLRGAAQGADPRTVCEAFRDVRGNRMSVAALEMAVWDWYAARTGQPLASLLGGGRDRVEVGATLGLPESLDALIRSVDRAVEQGFRRVKLKIAPGRDQALIEAVRLRYPDLAIAADANGSYRPEDAPMLQQLDVYGLQFIEQPLPEDDWFDLADLQDSLRTPICLDESVRSVRELKLAARLGSARVLNVKPGRLGGFGATLRALDVAGEAGMAAWVGGMYETGVGRVHGLIAASLPLMRYATDLGPSDRYFERDVLKEPIAFVEPGVIQVPQCAGVADWVDRDAVRRFSTATWTVDLRTL
ncbi:o-succinylbenzoate synthase [Alicyclobacillus acidocaldarius]|uniref:o-succinylbenzoate synthase n=1 Tax=Alicyclobacillus acidocaldarius subsp. acidocaldarius (strain ATCC 27009 / DSM 446 / BCRC 14685 / JCM 5260 / KCTC 1825 / NBRC 15652 / NCIMB 11725 / NRRL B-14509 / 104-IA) TaxID=521098 RepID=C8WS29_ALIAD|nr:o-succinylbenzoate synthase [Alicyclobacillus acidocaldarius]ACV57463.1 Mandelate racemase/muconate lactonizing protein [Alicyclobacillus acidocaldarius subsp. acidocaldarius DSM 446]